MERSSGIRVPGPACTVPADKDPASASGNPAIINGAHC